MKMTGREGNANLLKNMKIIRIYSISFFLLLISFGFSGREIHQSTFIYADKPDIEVYYSLPEEVNDETMVLFIIHGASRTAEGYLEDFLPQIQEKNFLQARQILIMLWEIFLRYLAVSIRLEMINTEFMVTQVAHSLCKDIYCFQMIHESIRLF